MYLVRETTAGFSVARFIYKRMWTGPAVKQREEIVYLGVHPKEFGVPKVLT